MFEKKFVLNITKGEISSISPVKKKEHWIINGNIEPVDVARGSSSAGSKEHRPDGG